MPRSSANALSLSHDVLRVLMWLNWIAGAFILALLIAGVVARDFFFTRLGLSPTGTNGVIAGARAIMIAGLIGVPLVHVILGRLLAIVRTVRAGDPFVPENAERLKHIAWSVLGLEVLHTVIASIAISISTAEMPIDIRWRLNLTRWLVVMLLFVLARVFEQGTRMRDDLDGTV
jgi:hypothetical protein